MRAAYSSRLSDSKVEAIKADIKAKMSDKDIAFKHGTTNGKVAAIRRKETYK